MAFKRAARRPGNPGRTAGPVLVSDLADGTVGILDLLALRANWDPRVAGHQISLCLTRYARPLGETAYRAGMSAPK